MATLRDIILGATIARASDHRGTQDARLAQFQTEAKQREELRQEERKNAIVADEIVQGRFTPAEETRREALAERKIRELGQDIINTMTTTHRGKTKVGDRVSAIVKLLHENAGSPGLNEKAQNLVRGLAGVVQELPRRSKEVYDTATLWLKLRDAARVPASNQTRASRMMDGERSNPSTRKRTRRRVRAAEPAHVRSPGPGRAQAMAQAMAEPRESVIVSIPEGARPTASPYANPRASLAPRQATPASASRQRPPDKASSGDSDDDDEYLPGGSDALASRFSEPRITRQRSRGQRTSGKGLRAGNLMTSNKVSAYLRTKYGLE